jgi:hypothetical protein
MNLSMFVRDLQIAAQYTDTVHIFSLEGCVERGWLRELDAVDWHMPVKVPNKRRLQMWSIRSLIAFVLWCNRSGWSALGWLGWAVAAGLLLEKRVRRWRLRRQR